MKTNVNRLSYIEYRISHVISFVAAAIEFNLSRQRNLQLAARRVLPQLNLICGSFWPLLCIVAPKVRVMLMARSHLPLQLRRLWLRFSCMQRGWLGGMLEQPFNSATAADAGVVNFYDAANRCKIAKQKKVYTLTHSHMHTDTHRHRPRHLKQHNGRPPGRQSAPELPKLL